MVQTKKIGQTMAVIPIAKFSIRWTRMVRFLSSLAGTGRVHSLVSYEGPPNRTQPSHWIVAPAPMGPDHFTPVLGKAGENGGRLLKIILTTPTPITSKKYAPKICHKMGGSYGVKNPLKERDFHRECGARTDFYGIRTLDFYGIRTPPFMPYEPFL